LEFERDGRSPQLLVRRSRGAIASTTPPAASGPPPLTRNFDALSDDELERDHRSADQGSLACAARAPPQLARFRDAERSLDTFDFDFNKKDEPGAHLSTEDNW
jgi:hypothetical protein